MAEWCFATTFRIGRDAACEVCLDHPRVHPRHAEVYLDGTIWRVRDLGRGDTLVNGAQLEEVRLGNPSIIQLGLYGPVLRVTLEPCEATPGLDRSMATVPAVPSHLVAVPVAPQPTPVPASPPTQPWDPNTPRYHGHGFSLPMPEAWRDRTLYTLAGPLADGIRHTLLIETNPQAPTDDLNDYTETQLASLQQDLNGFRLIKRDLKTLEDGTPAARLIYGWALEKQGPLFQEQLFVLHQGHVYRLTATFTNASRKQVGEQVEAMMLAFTPTAS